MAARRSQRIVRRRRRASRACVRSTTRRWRPSRSERSTPAARDVGRGGAGRGVVERARRPGRGIEGARRLRPHRACGAGIAGRPAAPTHARHGRRARRRARPRARPRAACRRAGSRRSSLDAERRAAGPGPGPGLGPGDERAPAQPGRPRSVGFGPVVARGEPSRRGRPLSPGWTRRPIEPPARLERIRRGRPLEPPPGADRPAHPPRAAPAAGAGRSCPRGRTPRAATAAGLCPSRAASTTPVGARSVTPPRAPFGFRRLGAPHRRHRRPRLVARKRSGHGPPTPHSWMGSVTRPQLGFGHSGSVAEGVSPGLGQAEAASRSVPPCAPT